MAEPAELDIGGGVGLVQRVGLGQMRGRDAGRAGRHGGRHQRLVTGEIRQTAHLRRHHRGSDVGLAHPDIDGLVCGAPAGCAPSRPGW